MIYLTKEEFKVEMADSFHKKVIGLMMRPNLDHALIMPMNVEGRKTSSIHSMFMRFTFDVLFLNSKCEVVDAATIKPWMVNFTPQAAAKYVIELPEYTIAKNLVNIGDRVYIDEIEAKEIIKPMHIKEYEEAFEKKKFDEKTLGKRPARLDEIRYNKEKEATRKAFKKIKKLTKANQKKLQKGNKKKKKQRK